MLARLIQQKVPLGTRVKFSLKTGREISGVLTEIGQDHITVESSNGPVTVLTEVIGLWENSENEVPESDLEPVDVKSDGPEEDVKNRPTEVPEEPVSPPADSLSPEATKKLSEIQARFDAQLENTEIELKHPDLTFPAKELIRWQNTDVAGIWIRLKNKYEYAQKINELSAKHGRIQPITSDLKSLTERFPNSPALKRALAYFYFLSGNWKEAIEIYQVVTITAEDTNDWFNMAVSALKSNKEELACYCLEKFFYKGSIVDEPKAWCAYVSLLEKFNNLPAFRELCRTDQYGITEEGIEVLFETSIYLLKKTGAEALATKIIQKRLTGESIKSLLGEVCQKLDDQPAESYRQFVTKFMNAMITSEKKTHLITPQRPEHISTVTQPVHGTTPQKQKSQTQVTYREEDLYAQAKRADSIEKNLEKAESLFREAIRQNIRPESAIKDLAMVLVRSDRPGEAVDLLEKKRPDVKDKQSLDNTLITVYHVVEQYEKVITLLNNFLKQTSDKEKRAQIRLQIASAYIQLGDYASAESQFRQVLKLRPDNITVQRNLALCLSKQDFYDEAEKILNRIQNVSRDAKTAELLEAIERAQRTGEFTLDDDSIIETETGLSYFSGELSKFAQFFLERCTFEGIPTGRINDGKYAGAEKDIQHDIGRLEDIAKQLGTKRPRDRSSYYLSAARIYFDVGANRYFFYRYLCRSFASRGDAALSENMHLDTTREWYCEALNVYDGDRTQRKRDEQDAVNSLVRYLYSTLGYPHIHLSSNSQSITIGKAIEEVINEHPDRKKAFDAIAYLVLHSRYVANRVLKRLYENSTLRTLALNYLKEMGIVISDPIERLNDFVRPWDELRQKKFNRARTISNTLRLLDNFELTTAWLEDNIRLVEDLRSDLFFELDLQRVGELQSILETALELCKQATFEERERLCIQLRNDCQARLEEIEGSPTKLSVEDVYPIIKVIQEKVNAYLEELYETSKPNLTIRLAVESYVPDTARKVEVQIVVENERERSPAESLELVIEGDQGFFDVAELNIKRDESLRGGDRSILVVPLRLTAEAVQSEAFSLPVYAQYGTRVGEQAQTPIQNLSIRLSSKDKFEAIKNPYARYAEGGVVGDPNMFFGRGELIRNIAQAIQESRLQSKCVMVFGQKRSGKTSVLHHLKMSLEKDKELLVLDLENIGAIQDKNSSIPLLYQILKSILTKLEYAIEDRTNDGFSSLNLPIPDDFEFYQHPAPLQYFQDTFTRLKRKFSAQEDWRDVRVVVLIDEFQYIYDRIVADEIPPSFMQNWKALLQANYFNAVLVGQDVMPKFKLSFPNEFGTTQDERVTYLKPDDARKLIDEPIRIGERRDESRYREQSIERISGLTAGSPFYIQIICNRLVEYMNIKHAELITEADVEQVKNELISGVNALGLDKFDNLINSGDTSADAISDEDTLKILKAIADNSRTGPCHRDRIVCETSSSVDTILDDLEKRDVVGRREQSYQIQVGLFKEWLIVNG